MKLRRNQLLLSCLVLGITVTSYTSPIFAQSLPREYGGVTLRDNINGYLNSNLWEEIPDQVKRMMFDSGFVIDERLLVNGNTMVGFLGGRLYKISVLFENRFKFTKIRANFISSFGSPKIDADGFETWKDNNTNLEMIDNGPMPNMIITDNELLLKGYGR